MKINVLRSEVFNQIAAGEVVEKPFNVVKELVENSIDAGATSIKIEIENGGIDLIRVTDNGLGIHKDDVVNAFASHATSKLSTIEDLQKLLTLGFRGEALSSISAVSKVNLRTKTQNDDFGTELINEGGNITSMKDTGMSMGSIFEVRDLFYNIPVRKKFLKKPKSEEADITDFVERLILSHPNISFSYYINDKQIYNFQASNLENAIFTIYGKETYDNLIKIEARRASVEGLTLTGFVGKPKIAKNSKKEQTLFVNGRFIKNQTIYSAIGRVFESYLMKGKYPFYVLNLTIPPHMIDVNIHPTKQEVKFEDNGMIFGFVYHAVESALLNANRLNLDDALSNDSMFFEIPKKQTSSNTISKTSLSDKPLLDLFIKSTEEPRVSISSPTIMEETPVIEAKKQEETTPDITEKETTQQTILSKDFDIIGRVFKTYIILQEGENIHFIDQHATHERLLFDKLVQESNNPQEMPKQQLLIPYIVTLTPAQNEIMKANLANLALLGLNFDGFGNNTYKLNEIPLSLKALNIDEFLTNLFEDKNSISSIQSSNLIRDRLATFACKSAIKAGDNLSDEEIALLINQLKEKNTVLLCPHGRPLIVTYSKKDLEKWFKRII